MRETTQPDSHQSWWRLTGWVNPHVGEDRGFKQDRMCGDKERLVHWLCNWLHVAERWVKAGRTARLKKAGLSLNPELWRQLVSGLLSAADAAEVSSVRAPSCLLRYPSQCSGCGRSQRTHPLQALPPPRPATTGAPPPAGGTTCAPTPAQTERKSKSYSEVYFSSQTLGF